MSYKIRVIKQQMIYRDPEVTAWRRVAIYSMCTYQYKKLSCMFNEHFCCLFVFILTYNPKNIDEHLLINAVRLLSI